MPIPISCSYCDVSYRITDRAAGKTIRCKECGEAIDVPDRSPARDVSSASRTSRRPEGDRYIRNRRQRERDDSGDSRNLIIGICCGAIALLGGGAFLMFGRGESAGDNGAAVAGEYAAGDASDENSRPATGNEQAFSTQLTRRGPSPQEADPVPPRSDVRAVTYTSAGRQLKAWMMQPNGPGPYPALVYLHGGFAFGLSDLDVCRPFLNEGFVVLAPSYRGENGNPGNFELMAGEVDDAVAAASWLATRRNVDAKNIYAFGHSVGGGISALLSLRPEAPIVHCGGAGGLYDESTFSEWRDIAPFDYTNDLENKSRVLKGREHLMVRDHYGYYGTSDFGIAGVARTMRTSGTKLRTRALPGDHFTSLSPAIAQYLQVVKQTMGVSTPSGSSGTAVASNSNPPAEREFPTTQTPSVEIPSVEIPETRPPQFSGPPDITGSPFGPGRRGMPVGPGAGRPNIRRPPGFPGGPNLPGTNRSNPGRSRPGITSRPGGGVPRNADTEEDFQAAVKALDSEQLIDRSMAIFALQRSKHAGAAAALGRHLDGPERMRIANALASHGEAGEAEILKAIDANDPPEKLRMLLPPLMRCGTAKAFPVLDKLQNHSDFSVKSLAEAARRSIELRARRRG